jgi:hypothetical protein
MPDRRHGDDTESLLDDDRFRSGRVFLAVSLLRLVCEHFVAPVEDSRQQSGERLVAPDEDPGGPFATTITRAPGAVALLSGPSDAYALGAALGLLLAGRHRSAAVAVCVWTGDGCAPRIIWRAPALPAARRLARGLAVRGHEAAGVGRLAVVSLPAVCASAVAEARRIGSVAASGGAPTVLAIGGPRVATFDALLAEQDLVVVATRGSAAPALARLAVEDLVAAAVCARACEVPASAPGRALAEAGLMLAPSVRRALAGPIEAMT